jgi:hypothetical protein
MSSPAARRGLAAVAAVGASLALPATASAHGIAQRADLPIPEWLFAWGAALVLLLSFAALALLWPRPRLQTVSERIVLRLPRAAEVLAGLLGVAAFAAVAYAGLAGSQTATANLAPTAVFVLFWIGIPFASVVLGDVFAAINPWRAVARGVAAVAGGLGVSAPAALPYPERLGRWPAAAGILLFGWFELVSTSREDPSTIALLALAYASIMLVGMALYGIETWTRNADAFAVAFGLFALLAPLRWEDRRAHLRVPLAGATRMPEAAGSVALVCVMIGTTCFDGFSQGSMWTGADGLAQRLTDVFADLGLGADARVEAAYTVGLVAIVLLVAGLLRLGMAGMSTVAGSGLSADQLARRFAHTLIPIAFAYVAAHYFSLLAFQGQAIAYLVSDPLGEGKDLFGTANSTIDYGLISSNGIWYVQVGVLVAGHIAALILAHDRALAIWSEPRAATRSQLWMLAVMVAFTSIGLWLLSEASQ